MADELDAGRGRTERQSGPRAGVVLLLTMVMAAGLIGGGVILADRLGNNDTATGPTTTATPLATAEADVASSANRLFDRTTDAGIDLRVYRTDENPGWGGPGFAGADLPGICKPNGMVQATAIGKAAVTTAQTMTTEEAPDHGNLGFGVGGVIEDEPILTFVIQTPSDVTNVGASTVNGGSDAMVPIDGVAALAMTAPDDLAAMWSGIGGAPVADPWKGIIVELRRDDGSSTRISGNDLQMGMAMWSDPACTQQQQPDDGQPPETLPPPTLPKGTGELPPDPAAAEREIKAAMEAVYAVGVANDVARIASIDDPSGVQFMIDRVRDDPNGRVLIPDHLEITEIGFLTDVEASFFYDLVLEAQSAAELPQEFRQQYGRARLIDGAWKITRATVCNDWERLGAICGP